MGTKREEAAGDCQHGPEGAIPDPDTLDAVLDALPEAIVLFNAGDGRIVRWNAEATRMFGYTAAEAIGGPPDLLSPEDAADGPMALLLRARDSGPVEANAVLRRKDGSLVEVHLRAAPIRGQSAEEVTAVLVAHRDSTPRDETERADSRPSILLDALMEQVPEGITIASAPDVRIERVSAHGLRRMKAAEEEVTGIPSERHPETWKVLDAQGERLLSGDELPLTRATKLGEIIENELLNLRLPGGGLLPILCNAGPIRDADGNITGGVITWRDVTELRQAEQARQLLARELHHRVKNLFSMVSAIVRMTARTSSAPHEMAEVIIGRISALARAHDIVRPLPGGDGEDVPKRGLNDLLETVLAPHLEAKSDRLHLDGPAVELGRSAVSSLALALHEFTTNSLKYGALSVHEGCVDVLWRVEGDRLVLEWEERNGPSLEGEPECKGFGSELARVSIERQLAGEIRFDWRKSGLRITLLVPMDRLME